MKINSKLIFLLITVKDEFLNIVEIQMFFYNVMKIPKGKKDKLNYYNVLKLFK
jgi:hypothetical protein